VPIGGSDRSRVIEIELGLWCKGKLAARRGRKTTELSHRGSESGYHRGSDSEWLGDRLWLH